jgi:hypothetical protein
MINAMVTGYFNAGAKVGPGFGKPTKRIIFFHRRMAGVIK